MLLSQNKWADSKVVMTKISAKQIELLGEKPKDDGKRKNKNKMSNEEKKQHKVNAPKDPEAVASSGRDILELIGRDCNIGANSEAILKKHNDFAKGRIITRFPPEPNGYLHIGHAKAIRFNFTVAAENGGETYLRFDDTNPCKENHEFIDHIKKNVAWLGYKPFKVTASSDYFQELFDLAVGLIK
jgi:glutaminyl-tRNA synthetase